VLSSHEQQIWDDLGRFYAAQAVERAGGLACND
jgi:hypothetical protein